MSKSIHSFLITVLLIMLCPIAGYAAPPAQPVDCAEEYTIQADDWLSKIADKYLGDMLAYPAIVAATNHKHAADATFAEITNPDVIEIGWKVCVPSAADAQAALITAADTASFESMSITDALNRTVEFTAPPQRIALAGRGVFLVTDALFMFPEAPQRVAVVGRRGQGFGDFLPLVDATYADKLVLEADVGVEQLAPTQPDAVILKSYMAEKLGAPLEQLGIKVVYVDLETPEQYFRDINILGQLFGNTTRTREIQTFYQARLDRVAVAVQGLSETQKPRVLILQHSTKGDEVAFTVPPATWIQTLMVELAGGIPVWRDSALGGGWQPVNFEQIAAWDPDVIVVIDYRADSRQIIQQLKADPQWQPLKAVQNERIYGFAGDFFSWDQPSPRWILGLEWLATKIHPERFSDLSMTQETIDFYGQMFGLDTAVVTAQILPARVGDVE